MPGPEKSAVADAAEVRLAADAAALHAFADARRRGGGLAAGTRRFRRAADARVVDVDTPCRVLREQLVGRQEEHVVAGFAGVEERRFAARRLRARGDQRDAAGRLRAAADAVRLVLVDVLLGVFVLRDERVGAVEEQPAAVGEVARLVERRW